jgi:hypothetical protein
MTEFFFNFKDLTNIQNPNKVMLNLSSFIISDDYIKKMFPKRYNFYMKFVDGFSSPSNLYKYLYRTKESKDYYEELQGKLAKISNSLSKLSNKNKKKVLSLLSQNLNNRGQDYNKFIDVISSITNNDDSKRTGGGGEGEGGVEVSEGEEVQKEVVKESEYRSPPIEPRQTQPIQEAPKKGISSGTINNDNDYSKNYYVKKPFRPMETFLNDVKKIAPVINLQS